MNEVTSGNFLGTLTINAKEYLLTGTNAMAKGPQSIGVAGFHVYDGKTWIGSVENFYNGVAYPSAQMPDESSDAFGIAVVIVAATGEFLRQDEQSIQANPIAFSQNF